MAAEQAVDAIIVGGGVMGSAAAWRLARAGQRVRLLEQFAIGHERGSSHGPSRMIRLAYSHPDYVTLGRAAFGFWRELEDESGQSLLRMTGGLDIGAPDAYHLEDVAHTYDLLGMPYERLERAELQRRYPQLTPPEGTIGLHSPEYGILAATRCVTTLADRARQAGADIRDGETVLAVVPDGEGVTIRTTSGEHRAASVILTAGSWTNLLLASLGIELPLTVLQEQLAFFRVRNSEAHGPDRMPLIIHRFPNTTMIGSYFPIHGHEGMKTMVDRIGPAVDPANPDRSIDPQRLERLRDYTMRLLPDATGEILETTSCRYTMTPDEDFILDHHPEYGQIVIASTCSGHGFKFAPVVGQILADLATTGETTYPIGLFRLDRPALAKSWSREVEESRVMGY